MSLLNALMEGRDLSREEAKKLIEEMRKRVREEHADPEEILYEEGLEPDYILEIL